MVLSNDNVTEGIMSTREEMTIDERFKYLQIQRGRYLAASRRGRGQLLTEMEEVTGLHRKALIRLMGKPVVRRVRQKQRQRAYSCEVEDALRVIAESLDYPCAERLTPGLPRIARHLARHSEMRLSPELLEQLERISVSTVRRILQRIGQDEMRLPRRGPERANQVVRQVPMRRIGWEEQEPGHFELDSVHHGGPQPTGEYVHTIQFIDVATGWSERIAVLGRSQLVVADAFTFFLARVPFPVLEVHSDNGSEFLNGHLLRFWNEKVTGIQLSRSRPYHKNDNRFVEQKNATLVRRYLGDVRLDTVAQTQALNRLYDEMWLFYNFFQPVMRLAHKEFAPLSDASGAVACKRRFDAAKTPFERLCETSALSDATRHALTERYAQINPRRLRQEIYTALDRLLGMPSAQPGVVEDVAFSLLMPTKLALPA
jgi:transposase InsO family protein